MKIRIRNMLLTILMITLLIIPTNQILAEKNETNNLYESWHIDNVKFYTNDNERICLYNTNDEIYVHSVNSGKLIWDKKDIGQVNPYDILWCHSTGGYPLIFATDSKNSTVSWYDLAGGNHHNKLGHSRHIFNTGHTIITKDLKEDGSNLIYDATTGELITTIQKKELNNEYIFHYEDSTTYSVSYSVITAQNIQKVLWKNIIRFWSDDKSQHYKEEYQYIYIPSDDYLFIRSVYFKGCCIYEDFTIKIINKKTGETAKDIKGLSYYAMFFTHNNNLYYSTDHDNAITDTRWRKVYDRQGHTNTLHKMDTVTFEDDWTLNSEEYNYIITKREQVVDGKLYIMLYDDCKYDEPLVHNKMHCIDVETGKILATYKFKDNIENFGFTKTHLLIETKDGVTCYAFNKEDLPPEEEPTQEISLKFQIGEKYYKLNDEDMIIDATPVILNGRTLLPARFVTEPLGGQVFWDGEERKVTCKLVAPDNSETEEYKENIVELWIGKSTAKVNGVKVQIDPNNSDVVPTIIDGRTMVPMRFLAESLGCEVEWIADTKEIILTYTP